MRACSRRPRREACRALLAPLLASPAPPPALRLTQPIEPPPASIRLDLGATTHFDQNWSLLLLGDAHRAGLTTIRDAIVWSKVERSPGVYTFDSFAANYTRTVCRDGLTLLLMVDPRNKLYDSGDTVRSAAGQAAYARFLIALIDHAGGCVRAIEMGNEINGAGGIQAPPGTDVAKSYAALLEAVVPIVKQRHPEVALLAGSVHSIATGFLARIAAAGGFAHVDGIAIHPYRAHPEGLDDELAHLRAVLRATGTDTPIWATELGEEVDDPALLAPYLLKAVVLLSSSGIAHAYWYALEDERWFRNMGLFASRTWIKPAGEAARLLTGELLNAGPARAIDTGDALTRAYRFGQGARGGLVLWGTPRPVQFTGTPRFRDARGRTIPAPTTLSDTPFVVSGTFDVAFGADPVIADTRYADAAPDWSALARHADGRMESLRTIDWEWTSFRSQPSLNPLAVNRDGAVLGAGRPPVAAVLRYTAPRDMAVSINACFTKRPTAAGVDVGISHGAHPVYRALLTDRLPVHVEPIALRAGETLDVALAVRSATDAAGVGWRIRLIMPGSGLDPLCD